jgi:hypothetical protein
MPQLKPYEWLLTNLRQELPDGREGYLSKEVAYRKLKQWTGQDFGYDIRAWEKWLKKNKMKVGLDWPDG